MGSVPVNTGGGTGNKGLAELNYHLRYEHKEVRDGVVGEGQDLSQEDESKINEVTEDVNVRRELAVQPQASLQKQPSGSVVRWERFLPLRSLKVLLVENDDCTRQVVSALLRNCSYEVVAVSNGVHAWKVLQDTTHHVDLVLTEVVMPCVSGIGLLCKIMNHDTYKNIPVIMMSSHDSMGVVFKCLSKGAVDFLVKPIRKNELKNLWQHVWRRCHSSCGSGSESGIQTRKSVKSKGIDESENNTGSNDEEEAGSVGLNMRDGSDNGSGTQSSWTKRAVEVDSPRPTSPWKQLTAPENSTCAQAIHPKFESFGKEWMSTGPKKDCSDGQLLDTVSMGKDLEIGVPRNSDTQEGYRHEKVCTNLIGSMKNRMPELAPTEDKELDYKPLQLDSDDASGELMAEKADNADLTTNCNLAQVENGFSVPPDGTKIPEIKHAPTSDAKEVPSLELSLKRLRDISNPAHDDRNVLRRSDLSAFSRYNTAYNVNQTPTAIVGSCSPLNNSSEAIKTDSIYNQGSNESSNNYDMSSTNKNVVTNTAAFNDKSASTSKEKCLYPSTFQPAQNNHGCLSVQVIPQNANDHAANSTVAQPKGTQQQVQVQHHHHYYHHHHHHVHKMSQQQGPPENEDLSLSMGVSGLQCGSSNMVGGIVEGTTGNYSLNGSASGSNHGSSRQNGNEKDVNASGMNIESDNGVVGKSGVGGSGSGSGSGVDQNRSAQRVAALTKFRQKRKERCFERKVRYQSRKRLAEQRPRVRGQFVRQKIYENAGEEAGC